MPMCRLGHHVDAAKQPRPLSTTAHRRFARRDDGLRLPCSTRSAEPTRARASVRIRHGAPRPLIARIIIIWVWRVGGYAGVVTAVEASVTVKAAVHLPARVKTAAYVKTAPAKVAAATAAYVKTAPAKVAAAEMAAAATAAYV